MPIVYKSCIRLPSPVQWRGGRLQELFKNKGSSKYLQYYRDVLLSDQIGKDIHRIIRKHVLPYVSVLVGKFQFGSGFNGGETAFAHLAVRLFHDYVRSSCKHASCIF